MKPTLHSQKKALQWTAVGAISVWAASWALAIPTPVDPSWSCDAAYWQIKPEMRNNHAEGKMMTECHLSGAEAASLKNLYAGWLGELKSTHELVAAPVAAKTETLPGVKLELIEKVRDTGNGSLVIHKEAQFASDHKTRFVYYSRSKSIQGGGNSSFLKRLNTTIEVTSVPGQPNRLRLRYSDQLAVERPWYAPDQIFLNEVSRHSLHNFEIARDKLTAHLLEDIKTRPPLVAFSAFDPRANSLRSP